jgi:hypothetical protein
VLPARPSNSGSQSSSPLLPDQKRVRRRWLFRATDYVPIFSVQLYIPVVSAGFHSLVIQFDLRPIYFALILRMPPPTNFIPTPPISQDDELVERLQALKHS